MDSLWSGALGAVLGAVIGAGVSCFVTYGFQKELLKQQLEAQEKSHQELIRHLQQVVSSVGVAAQRGRIA